MAGRPLAFVAQALEEATDLSFVVAAKGGRACIKTEDPNPVTEDLQPAAVRSFAAPHGIWI